jgi:hypothetical protein
MLPAIDTTDATLANPAKCLLHSPPFKNAPLASQVKDKDRNSR